ncbi:MAG: hypothetical protein HYZ42_16045, partial [Bacteroidetes bacterium]|nr:hypothetical protein [Bacteroidota bacterium]
RLMPNVSLDYNPSAKWGINGQYNLVHATQKIVIDTGSNQLLKANLMNQNNHTITVMPRYILKQKSRTYMFMLMETYQWVADKNVNTKLYSDMTTSFTNASCNLTFLPSGVSVNSALFMSHIKNTVIDISTYGLTVGSSKSFLKNKLSTGGTLSISSNPQSTTYNLTSMGTYKPNKHHSLNLNISLLHNAIKNASSGPSFTEFQGRFNYMYSF